MVLLLLYMPHNQRQYSLSLLHRAANHLILFWYLLNVANEFRFPVLLAYMVCTKRILRHPSNSSCLRKSKTKLQVNEKVVILPRVSFLNTTGNLLIFAK